MEPNMAAVFSYMFPIIGGVVFFTSEKKNTFIKFHALQSFLFWLAVWGAMFIAQSLTLILIGFLLLPIVSLGAFVIWVYLMWKAYNNIEIELPYIGKFAREQINKS
ncbi:hypothetical protein A3K34_00280 [candidate division WWE3 bacterium RIFOXYC1_FULL_40_10]|uniref:DUF4870 domain-containing protein n=1 Tax=candidate division WWE3 bacterium RIFOXYA2_FULL_46_9 TaxID=1802636 RepID=A0A1F4W1M5_UNCKA|nr:MAG: hypothetical protein A3K58_00280 [candidate division WWE3 bacterium RIFOXYB1_FULL_40_22]OGC62178.1 MAG: hypothetical protein A3K37_00280 [candidate division WWE3 bacterium RIFOXYA1_FULL_40_11]OGC63260.1 MAG: hypothetical protein A2264_00935 [candidate division WWE3 bacterium RIFOXYA2_FULL_46_9]OGC65410.1 MAG: hypothetical protein A2326_04565 [candidate division WWE3 bacterium RIFOXYB2_FULL_41_6]OGC66561.1 MAG: hypothetical protein A3K34_00280 [candidate division WWE3 bacterium RIFOXYC1_